MLPNQVLPAIPRQKVLKDGYVYNVLATNPDNTMILQLADLSQKDKAMQTWSYAKTEDCEPVPEEPRPFRVGDKVKFRNLFTTISEIAAFGDGKNVYVLANGGQAEENDWILCHATPEELAKYFN